MAPTKVKTGSSRGNNKRSSKSSTGESTSKQKPKSSSHRTASSSTVKRQGLQSKNKRKRKEYSEKELNIPKLNMITPAGVQKPKGKKKGKVFVDDQESMMTILAMVNADKEGQIESKMVRARQMEEIRQARQKEMEARAEQKKAKLDETKNSLRRTKRKMQAESITRPDEAPTAAKPKPKKRVSFG